MRYFFRAILVIIERMLKLLVYYISILYGSSVKRACLLFTFLYLIYSYISAKLGLLKNILINSFNILLAYINISHI